MLVANSFDLWQKDVFFSAAEEVQESADIMESVYRTWVRETREGLGLEDSDELRRELQTALGTAKWQLEEFERAVSLSHGNRSEDNTIARHRQFVAAVEDQISRVEKELRDSLSEEGKQPLRWVNLDEGERDDLVAFLSGTPGTLQSTKDKDIKLNPSTNSSLQLHGRKPKDADLHNDSVCKIDMHNSVKGFKEVVTINNDAKYIVELEAKELPGTRDDLNCQMDRLNGQGRTWRSPNFGAWKIVIADEDEQRNTLGGSVESKTRGKRYKNSFRKQKGGEHLHTKGISRYLNLKGINSPSQLFGRVGGFQRQLQGPQYMQFSCSLQTTLVLMLTLFLIVPFVLYST